MKRDEVVHKLRAHEVELRPAGIIRKAAGRVQRKKRFPDGSPVVPVLLKAAPLTTRSSIN